MADPNFETLLGAIHEIKRSVDELRQSVDALREEQTCAQVAAAGLVDQFRGEVMSLRDDAFVTRTHAENVGRVTREADLSAELSGIHRQIRHLQEEVRTLRGAS